MGSSMKSKNKLEGATNFKSWKIRIDLIIAKNDVLDIVNDMITKHSIYCCKLTQVFIINPG